MNDDPNVRINDVSPVNSGITDSVTTLSTSDIQVNNYNTIGSSSNSLGSGSNSQKVTEANCVLPSPIVSTTRRVKQGKKNSTNQTQSTLTATTVSTDPIVPTDRVEPKRSTSNKAISSSKSATNVKKSREIKTARRNRSNTRADLEETQTLWKMRWFYFWVGIALGSIWMLALLAASLYVFTLTRNYLSFLISAAIAIVVEFMRRFGNYLLPIDDKTYKLKKKELELDKRMPSRGKQSN